MHCDFDLDDVFAYTLPRRVIVRHRVLGLVHISIMLGLFIYVVVFEVIINKGYLKKDDPVGFSTMSVRRDAWETNAPYCCPPAGCGGVCTAVVPPPSPPPPQPCTRYRTRTACDAQQGCLWQGQPSRSLFGSATGQLECVEWDRYNALMPYSEEYSMLLSTRVTLTTSYPLPPHCRYNRTSSLCPSWVQRDSVPLYVTGVEDMVIRFDHGVYGRETNQIKRASDMRQGVVNGPDGEPMYSFCGGEGVAAGTAVPYRDVRRTSCQGEEEGREGDTMTVQQILDAAGIGTLDARRSLSNNTARYDGIVLLIVMNYDGRARGFGRHLDLEYSYNIFALDKIKYRYEEPVYEYQPDGQIVRTVLARHGVRLILASAGYVAVVSFVELMKTLMIASGMLAVARLIVDFVVIPMLPRAEIYRRYRDVKTVDFSDVAHQEWKDLTDLDYALGVVRNSGEEMTCKKEAALCEQQREAAAVTPSDSPDASRDAVCLRDVVVSRAEMLVPLEGTQAPTPPDSPPAARRGVAGVCESPTTPLASGSFNAFLRPTFNDNASLRGHPSYCSKRPKPLLPLDTAGGSDASPAYTLLSSDIVRRPSDAPAPRGRGQRHSALPPVADTSPPRHRLSGLPQGPLQRYALNGSSAALGVTVSPSERGFLSM